MVTANNLNSIQRHTSAATAAVRHAAWDWPADERVEASSVPQITVGPSFVAGTMIDTEAGRKSVDDLCPGDQILTQDAGAQPIVGIRKVVVPYAVLAELSYLRPIRLPDGFLGASKPLMVSPEQRIMITSVMADLLFDDPEVFVLAKDLVGLGAEAVVPLVKQLEYFQILLADHHVIKANGVWSETLFSQHLKSNEPSMCHDWRLVEGQTLEAVQHQHMARPVLKKFEAQALFNMISAGR